MSTLWKIVGALSAIVLVIEIALGMHPGLWTLMVFGMSISQGVLAVIRDFGRAAREDAIDGEIYGRDDKGRAKKPTYHM
jgi:hypothetical protein